MASFSKVTLLTDESSLGLSPNYVDLIFENAIAHRGYVFKIGEIVLEDKGKNLLENEEVKRAFLGG